METDSLVLKAGVDGKHENCTWEILPILLEIRCMEAMFDVVELSWIPRKKNLAAHAAASFGIRAVHRVTWLDQPSPSLMGVLTSDGLHTQPHPPPFPLFLLLFNILFCWQSPAVWLCSHSLFLSVSLSAHKFPTVTVTFPPFPHKPLPSSPINKLTKRLYSVLSISESLEKPNANFTL
ncbi:hypothetical protein GBA52_010414 [Prunus armeniaca]|nr:hypothetical protein GBA52_010414 [Prunus armeniaca]